MVSTRLDYRNSVLYNTLHCNISKLQCVHNALSRAATCTRKRDHIMPILADLYWLPIAAHIDYKVALLTFKTLTTKQPSYLHKLLHVHRPARLLRSNEHINWLHDNGARTSFATRAFSHAAPTIWNSLPQELTNDLSSLSVFKRNLKTFLYSHPFSQWHTPVPRLRFVTYCDWLMSRYQLCNYNNNLLPSCLGHLLPVHQIHSWR